MADEWSHSNGEEFFPYPDSWWWNGTHARKTGWGFGPWEIVHPVVGISEGEDVWSFDEAARATGLRGDMLASLLRHSQRLQVRSLQEVVAPTGRPCTRFDLEGGWMGQPNGFLHCLGATKEIRLEQVNGSWLCPAWVQKPASDYKIIDKDWAYFELPLKP